MLLFFEYIFANKIHNNEKRKYTFDLNDLRIYTNFSGENKIIPDLAQTKVYLLIQ
jgi:hypothetical protein